MSGSYLVFRDYNRDDLKEIATLMLNTKKRKYCEAFDLMYRRIDNYHSSKEKNAFLKKFIQPDQLDEAIQAEEKKIAKLRYDAKMRARIAMRKEKAELEIDKYTRNILPATEIHVPYHDTYQTKSGKRFFKTANGEVVKVTGRLSANRCGTLQFLNKKAGTLYLIDMKTNQSKILYRDSILKSLRRHNSFIYIFYSQGQVDRWDLNDNILELGFTKRDTHFYTPDDVEIPSQNSELRLPDDIRITWKPFGEKDTHMDWNILHKDQLVTKVRVPCMRIWIYDKGTMRSPWSENHLVYDLAALDKKRVKVLANKITSEDVRKRILSYMTCFVF